MPQFLFTAQGPGGQETSGLVDAATEAEASTKLAGAGYTVVRLTSGGALCEALPRDGFFAWGVLAIGQATWLLAAVYALKQLTADGEPPGWIILGFCVLAFFPIAALNLVFSRVMEFPAKVREQAIAQAVAIAQLRQEVEDLRQRTSPP